MEFRKLEYFLAVAEELHFGRAARRMHVSQPPLSQQVRKLEDELGVQLFARTSRRVELTPAGQAFYEDARDVLAAVRRAAERAVRVASGEEGRVRVGFVTPAMDGPLPGVVRAFGLELPGVRLELQQMATVEQLTALRSGDLDAGFVRLDGDDADRACGGNGLAHELLLREEYVLALPPGHELAQQTCVDLALLDREPLIVHPRSMGPALLDSVFAVLARAGAHPVVAQEAATKQTALALCSAGVGLAIVPRSSAMAHGKGAVVRPLAAGLPQIEIRLVYKKRERGGHSALERLATLVCSNADIGTERQ